MRKAAQIAGAAAIAALLLSGCGSGGGGEESKPSPSASADGADKTAKGLDGAWQSKSANGTVTLGIIGESATLAAGKTACQGAVQDMGTTMLALKCDGGDDTRSMGTVKQAGGKLTVSWKNGPTEEFTKAEGKVEIPKPDLPTGAN
ncbi:hypothetical protein C3486_07380 [Streptomyces sp. Ru73]|uniref:hypothetical protein n=1 Tax=Streptomyces sp. Ru73 TaxID=2080748 RepID=UPI000CDD393B|nr:hypothetical protein [Streptomyces sp. Ru73]POX41763.1 hypothetical protein C3486_07380 [Streptomyces sp. Ru73]